MILTHENIVDFSEAVCCVFRRRNKLSSGNISESEWSMFAIFENTVAMAFIPNTRQRKCYLQAAITEIQRLENLKVNDAACGHTKEQHIHALKNLCVQLTKDRGRA